MSVRPTVRRPSVRVHTWRRKAAVTLGCGDLEATFLPDVMLGTSVRWRGEEFLALPGSLEAYRQRRVTGLPLLAPWANRLGERSYVAAGVPVDLDGLDLATDEHGLPIHGTITARTGWEILGLDSDGDRSALRAAFDYGAPDLLAAFPFPHVLGVEVTLDEERMTITTALRPTSDRPVPVSFGYHPYFRLPDAPTATWRLHLPEREQLTLDERGLPTGERSLRGPDAAALADRSYDDLFALHAARRLGIESDGHRLTVEFGESYPFAQVYRPPGGDFVCLEPMTAPTNALLTGEAPLVSPGNSFVASFRVMIEDEKPRS